MSDLGPAPGLEAVGMTKRFGEFTALDAVSLKVRPGTFHALLGENIYQISFPFLQLQPAPGYPRQYALR